MKKEKNVKKYGLNDIVADIKKIEKGKKVKTEKIDHDLIAYGVSHPERLDKCIPKKTK
ncbi:MAG: hypothetical protein ABIH83_00190 [Candidatus Micrarchaeota archaeon]